MNNEISNEELNRQLENAPKADELQSYEKEYSEQNLWEKVKHVAQAAGLNVIYPVVLLYEIMRSGDVSVADKAVIVGALGYFILPIDLIADTIPGIGFMDDYTVLLAALEKVAEHITPEIDQQARKRLHEWFGDFDEADLKIDYSKVGGKAKLIARLTKVFKKK